MSELDPRAVLLSCSGKARYTDEETARRVATDCWYKRRVNLRAYLCPACAGFHLTRVDAAPVMRAGWRLPKKSERQKAQERKKRKRQR